MRQKVSGIRRHFRARAVRRFVVRSVWRKHCVSLFELRGHAFQRRLTVGGTSAPTGVAGAAPMWVKLARAGTVVTASVSSDGTAWADVGQETVPFSGGVWAGLAVTRHDTTRPASATFDDVTVTTDTGGSGIGAGNERAIE